MQITNTDLRTALIEGADSSKVINYAHDFTDLLGEVRNPYGFFQTLGENLKPTGSENGSLPLTKGVAFVKYEKTSGEIGFLKVQLVSDQILDLGAEIDGTYYLFFNLDQTALDDGGSTVDGNDVAEIKLDTSYPAANFLPIAKVTKASDVITVEDLRRRQDPVAKMYEFGLTYTLDSLDISVEGGVYNSSGDKASDTDISLTANSTNYVEIDTTDGSISTNTSAFSNIPLYVITTNDSGVESVDDLRLSMLVTSSSTPIATQAEAEAGTDNTKMMTPLTTVQSIASNQNISETNAGILTGGSDSDASDLHTHESLGMFVKVSDNLRVSNNTEALGNSSNSSTYISIKSLTSYRNGQVRIKYDAYYHSSYAAGSIVIFVNGVAASASQSITTSYTQYSVDIDICVGDVIEIKGVSQAASVSAIYVRNAGMYCDMDPDNMYLFGA